MSWSAKKRCGTETVHKGAFRRNPAKRRLPVAAPTGSRSGFSLIEVIVVFSIIGVMAGVGALGYKNMIGSSRVSSASTMITAQLRQARQYAVALRQSRRVVIRIERLSSSDGGSGSQVAADRSSPALQTWVEGKRDESRAYNEVLAAGRNAIQITDAQNLSPGITLGSVYLPGYELINPLEGAAGMVRFFYVEFNSRGQLAGVYFGDPGPRLMEPQKAQSIVGGQVFLHFTHWAERIQYPPNGEEYYEEMLEVGKQLADIHSDNDAAAEFIRERYKVSTVEVLRLTGRVREYDYGYGAPWSVKEMS